MRKPVLLIWTNAAILVVLFALMSQSLFIVTRIARLQTASGQVSIARQNQGEWMPVSAGVPLAPGDAVQTGRDGRAEFAWADGTRWKLEPNTRLVVERASANSRQGSEQTRLRLENGKVWVRVVKPLGAASRFQIETPSAIASVRGTVWSIEVVGDGTRVGVWKGFVDVKANGTSSQEYLTPGTKAVVNASGIELQSATAPDEAAFQAQDDLVHPQLEAQVKFALASALLSGQTEAGDALTVNGKDVSLLSNGAFLKRVALVKGHNQWKFTSTDKHGQTSSACRALEFNGQKATPGACR